MEGAVSCAPGHLPAASPYFPLPFSGSSARSAFPPPGLCLAHGARGSYFPVSFKPPSDMSPASTRALTPILKTWAPCSPECSWQPAPTFDALCSLHEPVRSYSEAGFLLERLHGAGPAWERGPAPQGPAPRRLRGPRRGPARPRPPAAAAASIATRPRAGARTHPTWTETDWKSCSSSGRGRAHADPENDPELGP